MSTPPDAMEKRPDVPLWDLAILLLLFLALVVPFSSHYLWHWDSVQYAQAMLRIDYRLHHPHPPGYFAWILMARALALVTDANTALVALNWICSAIAGSLLYLLGWHLGGRRTGWLAAALYLLSPIVWKYNLIAFNQSACGLTCVIALFVTLWPRMNPWKGFLLFFLLGTLLGARASDVISLGPLIAFGWWFGVGRSADRPIATRIAMVAGGLLGVAWWLALATREIDSWQAQRAFNSEYFAMQLPKYSIVFGAPVGVHARMLLRGVLWFGACLGLGGAAAVLAGGWTLLRRRPLPEIPWIPLALAVIVPALPLVGVHIAQPAHWMVILPGVCLLLALLVNAAPRVGRLAVVVALGVGAFLFVASGIGVSLYLSHRHTAWQEGGAPIARGEWDRIYRWTKYSAAEIVVRDWQMRAFLEAVAQAPIDPSRTLALPGQHPAVDFRRGSWYLPQATWTTVLPEFKPGDPPRYYRLIARDRQVRREWIETSIVSDDPLAFDFPVFDGIDTLFILPSFGDESSAPGEPITGFIDLPLRRVDLKERP